MKRVLLLCLMLASIGGLHAANAETYFLLGNALAEGMKKLIEQTIWGPVVGVRAKSAKAAGLSAMPAAPAASFPLPDFRTLAGGAQQVRLLPGQHEFVFSMYGALSGGMTTRV